MSDIKHAINYRYGRLYRYSTAKWKKYDWKYNGILGKVMPDWLFKTKNEILNNFLCYIDVELISLFTYIEKLKNFKNINKA
jgi:hypothetical protein